MDSDPNIPTRTAVRFKTLVRNTSGPKAAISEVLDDANELDAYRLSCRDPNDPGFKQTVGFPDEVAVTVALGQKPTLGFDVQVIAVIRETGGIVGVQHHVLYVVTEPHGPAGDVVTWPHHVIRVRGLHGIVHFRRVPDTLGPQLAALSARDASAGAPAAPATTAQPIGDLPLTFPVGEHGGFTTLMLGEEGGGTGWIGEHGTSFFSPWEEGVTTLRFGEEGIPSDPRVEDPFGGQGGGRGPFG